MDSPIRCPRCQTDMISSFPFGFVKTPDGPSRTYICSRCRFLFAMSVDISNQVPSAKVENGNIKARMDVPQVASSLEEAPG